MEICMVRLIQGVCSVATAQFFAVALTDSLQIFIVLMLTPAGDGPLAGVVQDVDGTLYGAMAGSWPYPSSGTLFRISTNGGYAPLVTFWGTNGASPLHDLIIGHDGALYGTTDGG